MMLAHNNNIDPQIVDRAMSAPDLTFIDHATRGRLGVFDVPCPQCGPERRRPINQRKPVLRVWRLDPNFASYHCARCGMKGHARDGSARHTDPAAIARAKAEQAEHQRIAEAERQSKAHGLWARTRPLIGRIGERYLREARGYDGPLPATLRFLPARGAHGPAMLAAFGCRPNRTWPARHQARCNPRRAHYAAGAGWVRQGRHRPR